MAVQKYARHFDSKSVFWTEVNQPTLSSRKGQHKGLFLSSAIYTFENVFSKINGFKYNHFSHFISFVCENVFKFRVGLFFQTLRSVYLLLDNTYSTYLEGVYVQKYTGFHRRLVCLPNDDAASLISFWLFRPITTSFHT